MLHSSRPVDAIGQRVNARSPRSPSRLSGTSLSPPEPGRQSRLLRAETLAEVEETRYILQLRLSKMHTCPHGSGFRETHKHAAQGRGMLFSGKWVLEGATSVFNTARVEMTTLRTGASCPRFTWKKCVISAQRDGILFSTSERDEKQSRQTRLRHE